MQKMDLRNYSVLFDFELGNKASFQLQVDKIRKASVSRVLDEK